MFAEEIIIVDDMTISALVQHLRSTLGEQGQLVHVEMTAARPALYGELEKPLPAPLNEILTRRGFRLYRHQAEAVDAARRGENVILSTATASGKSLAFNLPVLESLAERRFATALYLYPLKALANDQVKTLQSWDDELGGTMRPAIYDGDTSASAKRSILERSRLILTNPYALNEYLPWHHLWRRFFLNLRYIVIDEAHVYRGIFGSHFACLLRRLSRILTFYRARPTFILSSATLHNPSQFAQALIGRPVRAVTEDGSPHGSRFFLLWNPPLDEGGKRRSPYLEARDLTLELVCSGLQTLCFTSSRGTAELLARWTREELAKKGSDLANQVAAYRAGYLAEDRRRLEAQLRRGELRAVFSTNALELGIDIGSLDAVLMAGYPGTMISVWQQAGRAGRGLGESLAILVGFANPLDQYFIEHPDRFFGRPLEEALLNPANPFVLRGHLQAAAAELPWRDETEATATFGPEAHPIYEELENEGFIAGGQYRGPATRTSSIVSLETISERSVQLMRTSSALGKDSGGDMLETLDYERALREAYPGAIYLHQGETFRVETLDLAQGVALLRPMDLDFYTSTRKDTQVRILEERASKRTPEGIEVALGEVEVNERILGYYVKRFDQTLDYQDLTLPDIAYSTEAAWFRVPEALQRRMQEKDEDFDGALHALEHATIALVPVFALCDRWDLGGVSYPQHPVLQGPAVFLYDGAPGGVGIAEKIYQVLPELLRATLEMIRACPCEDGCPSCVLSPKCGNNNQPMSKSGAIRLLQALLANSPENP